MKPLNQEPLEKANPTRPVLLVRWTFFTDRRSKEVETELFLSDRTVVYDYGNAGTDRTFFPLVTNVSDIIRQIPHRTDPDSFYVATPLTLTLANREVDGTRLSEYLRARKALFSEVEIVSVQQGDFGSDPWDLRSLSGTEHVVWYRGRLAAIESITEHEVLVRFEDDVPEADWIRVSSGSNPLTRHTGIRVPVAYGKNALVECAGWTVGNVTTLSQTLEKGATGTVKVTDASIFPVSTSFDVLIAGERVTCSGADPAGGTITITARGQNGTFDTFHEIGDPIVHILDTTTYIVSGVAVSQLHRLLAQDPQSDAAIELGNAFTLTLADTSTVPGKTVTSVSFTKDEWHSLLRSVSRQAAVTAQPAFRSATGSVTIATANATNRFTDSTWVPWAISFSEAAGEYKLPRFDSPRLYTSIHQFGNQTISASGQFKRYRFKISFTVNVYDGYGPITAVGRIETAAGFSTPQEFSATFSSTGLVTMTSDWSTDIWASDYNTLINGFAQLRFYIQNSSRFSLVPQEGNQITVPTVQLEIEDVQTDLTQIADAEITADQRSLIPRIFAEVDGPTADARFIVAEGFETPRTWSTTGWLGMGQSTTVKIEGEQSLTLIPIGISIWLDLDDGVASWNASAGTLLDTTGDMQLHSMDDLTGWGTNTGTLSTDTTRVKEGTGSLKLAGNQTNDWAVWSAASAQNITGKAVSIWAYVPQETYDVLTDDANSGAITLSFEQDFSTGIWHNVRGPLKSEIIPDTWQKWTWNIEDVDKTWNQGTSKASANNVKNFYFIRYLSGATASPVDIWFDDLRVEPWNVDGSGSVYHANASTARITRSVSPAQDLRGAKVKVAIYDLLAQWTGSNSLTLYLSDSAGSGSGLPASYRSITVSASSQSIASGKWGHIVFDVDSGVDTGTPNMAAVSWLALEFSGSNWAHVYDSIRIERPMRAQVNNLATGSNDWSSVDDEYEVDLLVQNDLERVKQVKIWWSDSVGSGSTPPADRFEITVNGSELLEGQWTTIRQTATKIGSPTANDVATLGLSYEGADDASAAALVFVDNLRRVDSAQPTIFSVSKGTVLEHPADAMLMVLNRMAGVPQELLDLASFGNAASNTGALKLSTDLRNLGQSLQAVLGRLGFESGINVIQVARNTGMLWVASSQDSSGSYGSSARTLLNPSLIIERSPATEGIASRFVFLYAPRPAGSEGFFEFTQMMVVDEETNDLVALVSQTTVDDVLKKFGLETATPIEFLGIQDTQTAESVAAYHFVRLTDDKPWFDLAVPHWDGIDLEPGDVVDAVIPWRGVSVKLRVVGVTRSWESALIRLLAREVT